MCTEIGRIYGGYGRLGTLKGRIGRVGSGFGELVEDLFRFSTREPGVRVFSPHNRPTARAIVYRTRMPIWADSGAWHVGVACEDF